MSASRRLGLVKPPAADGPVVLFDGVCNLCNGWVRFVVRRDPAMRFRFAPLQSEFGATVLPAHGLSRDALDSVLLLENGILYSKSDAVLRVARAVFRAALRGLAFLRVVRFFPLVLVAMAFCSDLL